VNTIDRALAGTLTPGEVDDALEGMIAGTLSEAFAAGFLVALRARPPTVDQLVSGAGVLRRHMTPVRAPADAIDTCGTGGDGSGTVNLSTGAALLCARMGVPVAKHGNRAVSSKAGSADVLEAMGIPIDLDADGVAASIARTNFGFMMAPRFHAATARIGPVRRALGIRTLFNLLGPLANPAGVRRQVVGVYDASLTGVVAEALGRLGAEHALVVHCDGMDEIGLHADTVGHRWQGGSLRGWRLPGTGVPLAELRGGDATTNAGILERALAGERGPVRDAIHRNAAAALEVSGRAGSFDEALAMLAGT
jgi:anthranilate phosphoribosyltransferase